MKQCLTPRWASDTGWDCLVPVFTLKIMIIGLHSTVGKWTRWCQVQWNILPAFNSLGLLECISTNQGFPIPWSAGKAPTGFYSAKTWDLPLSHNSIPSLLFQYRILIPQHLAQHSKITWSLCTDHPVIRLIGLLPGGPIKIDFSNTTLSGTCKRGRVREREASTICAIT